MSNGHRPDCDGCVRCDDPGCEEVAYCVNEWPVENLCPHYVQAVCIDHWPGTCPRCQEEAERDAEPLAAIQAAFDRYDGDPFYNPSGDHSDPLHAPAGDRHRTFNSDWRARVRADREKGLA